ncbi:MAG TPA: HlyD family efflux transporter periplasmic adaptor subunit [Gemmatimonadales bacterium]
MDVARPPQKKTGRNIGIGVAVLAVVITTIAVARLKPAAPTVDLSVSIVDSVRRGDMVREMRGPGTLVPEQIQQVTAPATARVDRMDVVAGQTVNAGDLLVETSSPDVMISTMNADQQLNQAQSNLLSLRSTLKSTELSQQGLVASTHTQYIAATMDAAAADTLFKQHLIAQFDVTNKHALADQLTSQYKFEQQRLQIMQQSVDSEIAAATTNIQQLKSISDFWHNKQKSLAVRSPTSGVVQGLTLQQGQFVTDGSLLLKVVQPGKLKAVLQIPESQAKDAQIGQSAVIDTRSNGLIPGHVSRKDPSAVGGTVTIDVALDGPLPSGAVPDLSVDGTIQIEKLKNVLYTGRPGYGSPTGPVGLFKIVENGHAAVRTQVLLGRSSVTYVEIVKGLNVGDKVILSDMSQYDGVDRVRLKQ